MELAISIVLTGIFATAVIDIWAALSNKFLGLPKTNWAMVGRWLAYLPSGQFIHRPIGASASKQHELLLGWLFHYLIGIAYALIYLPIVLLVFDSSPSLLTAWIFGVVTIVFPWFMMQPGMGLGICAANAPQPRLVRLQNLAVHSLFGIALYYGWMAAGFVL